jgi:hypothetical protein
VSNSDLLQTNILYGWESANPRAHLDFEKLLGIIKSTHGSFQLSSALLRLELLSNPKGDAGLVLQHSQKKKSGKWELG